MFATLARLWSERGFTPHAVVIDAGPVWSPRRLVSRLRRREDDSEPLCRRLGWPYVSVTGINAAAAVSTVARLAPDVAVNAGAGILRRGILGVPAVGTLGTHMGLLPAYRGMNVAEWAAINGDPVGCSVFWIDEGIDTGDIICTHVVDVSGCRSVAELRRKANDVQIRLLAERAIEAAGGHAVPRIPQRVEQGRQFYRMHRDLLALLEERLRAA